MIAGDFRSKDSDLQPFHGTLAIKVIHRTLELFSSAADTDENRKAPRVEQVTSIEAWAANVVWMLSQWCVFSLPVPGCGMFSTLPNRSWERSNACRPHCERNSM